MDGDDVARFGVGASNRPINGRFRCHRMSKSDEILIQMLRSWPLRDPIYIGLLSVNFLLFICLLCCGSSARGSSQHLKTFLSSSSSSLSFRLNYLSSLNRFSPPLVFFSSMARGSSSRDGQSENLSNDSPSDPKVEASSLSKLNIDWLQEQYASQSNFSSSLLVPTVG